MLGLYRVFVLGLYRVFVLGLYRVFVLGLYRVFVLGLYRVLVLGLQELSGVDYICMCALGFTGRNCEVNIDECRSDPCHQLGVCLDGVNSYRCACMKGQGQRVGGQGH